MAGFTDCPRCQGQGVIVLYINEWGKAETTDCSLCDGSGETRSDVAADWWQEVGS